MPESCYLINCTYVEVKVDPGDAEAGIWAKSLLVRLNSPQLRKICMCSFRLGVRIFMVAHWHLECLHWRLVSFRACFRSLHLFSLRSNSSPPLPGKLHYYYSGWVSHSDTVSMEFSLFILTVSFFETTWYSPWLVLLSSALVWTDAAFFSQTHHCTSVLGGVVPWHYPTESQALLIAQGLSGVSGWLFSPDIIISRVETVTRGWAQGGRVGVSYPQFQNNICGCQAPKEVFFFFFFPHNGFRGSSSIVSSDFHNTREDRRWC